MTRDLKLLLGAIFTWGVGEGLFYGLLPLYLHQLGAPPVIIGSVMSLSMLGLGLSHAPAGWLADRMQRKTLMLAAWVLATLGALGMFLAPNLAWFTPALVAYVMSGGAAAPRSTFLIDVRGRYSVQHVFSLYTASASAGAIFSPAVGGLIAQALGIRAMIGLAALIFVVSTALMLGLREPAPTARAAGAAPPVRALLANPRFTGFLLLSFGGALAFQVGFPLAPNFLAEVRRLDVGLIGLLGSFERLGMTLLNFVVGRRAPRWAYLTAQGMMAAGLGLLLTTGNLGALALTFFFRGSWSLARNMTNAQVRLALGEQKPGLAYGLTESVMAAALILGPLAAGWLYARAPQLPFVTGLALLLLTMPLVAALAPHAPRSGTS